MPNDLIERTKQFAVRVIHLVEALPSNRVGNVLGGQLLRAGTSVGANYRAACRARSRADFIAKMKIVEEEADESTYWIELLVAAGLMTPDRVAAMALESNALTAIAVASIKTARKADRQSDSPDIRHSSRVIRHSSVVTRH